jgi:glycosyltransferase involved in cell wall biosynthesis
MPFPSPQGSQAAVHAMLTASTEAGEDAHLLVYGHGAGGLEAGYPVHRLPRLPLGRSLRSGPSAGKVVLDAAMVARTAQVWERLRPAMTVAHNVEAALVAIAARVPFVYFAHTAMEAELPFFAPRPLAAPAAAAGRLLDALACHGALGIAAIAPALSASLERRREVAAPYVPLPWAFMERRAGAAPTDLDGPTARRALGLAPEDRVLLYAGNLDAYQGYEDVVAAAARLAARVPEAKLLVATASAPGPLVRAARGAGLGARLVVTGLADEAARRAVHAAADVALVPRRAPGGLPIKLLDALARGVPVVASRRAAAGLPIARAALLCRDDDPASMAAAAELALAEATRDELRREGRAYVAREHAAARFVDALAEVLGEARRKYQNR